mmetsp:Transcript_8110/g.22932  ORF Transcript_8110/g.22932 Transcript_8110/m.22932 type:complete len:201 (-) Transcript_8110:399-1001(-)
MREPRRAPNQRQRRDGVPLPAGSAARGAPVHGDAPQGDPRPRQPPRVERVQLPRSGVPQVLLGVHAQQGLGRLLHRAVSDDPRPGVGVTYTAQASGAPALHVGSAALSHISDVTHHSMSCVMKCSVTLSQKKVRLSRSFGPLCRESGSTCRPYRLRARFSAPMSMAEWWKCTFSSISPCRRSRHPLQGRASAKLRTELAV